MSPPISEILLPERAPSSRKFSEQECAEALDLLTSGKVVSDGQEYGKEDAARSTGNSLKNGIRGAAQKRGGEAPPVAVKVREQSPGGFVFGLTVKSVEASEENAGLTADTKRADLEDAARERGINPDDHKNKKDLLAAIRESDKSNE